MTKNHRIGTRIGSGFALGLALFGCGPAGFGAEGEELLGETAEEVKVGSMMNCPNGVNGACTVLGMPLLWQSSNLVDVDITPAVKGVGCYDTSITTLLDTALANRSTARALTSRTSTWDGLVAGNNGAVPPLATTKAYEQLTQQYRWAALRAPMYFHEMLQDFVTAGTTVRKYPTGCNPDVYGSCSWMTTVLSNDMVGAAFRNFESGAQSLHYVRNDYIRNLMNTGFGTMIAFGRYKPLKVWDNALNGYRMTFSRQSQHKVTFSGYQPGTYPLRINDVGDGRQYNVSVTDDVALVGTFDGIAASTVKAWDFPNGRKAHPFVRYDPAAAPTTEVYFVDHVDGFSLSLPTAGPVRQVFNGGWSTGWTTLMPFQLNGEPHQIAYNTTTGAVHFDKFFANSNGTSTVWSHTWGRGFTHMVPYYIGGHPYFVAYNSATGELHYDTFPTNLQGPIIKGIKTIGAGFTNIEPFVMGGSNYLLLYNRTSGAVRFEKINASGSDSTTSWNFTWGTGWTDFATYDIAGVPHMVAYNATTGLTHYDTIVSNGVSILSTATLATGMKLKTMAFRGAAHVFAYRPSSGAATTRRLATDGTTSADAFGTTALANATSIVPFVQAAKPYVLLYNKNNGTVRSYETTMF